jgi:excisionase family DNA binding protein
MDLANKRVIDLTLEELVSFLDERYAKANHSQSLKNDEAQFLNVNQCAVLTGYSPDYVRQLVFKRAIPFYKVRRLLRFMRAEIVEWMSRKKHLPIDQLADEYLNKIK